MTADASSPYFTTGPALLSFSGGRTSAFMLHETLRAHGGTLPSDMHVVFANTGKERAETLRFVHECEVRWSVPIHWVEWRATPTRAAGTASLAAWLDAHDPERRMVAAEGFERVGLNSASRRGEPFAALIAMKQRLPNWQERWCTEFLKVAPMKALAASFGWELGAYTEVIGLRDDEGPRILRAYENATFRWDRKSKSQVLRTPPRLIHLPLALARLTKADVMAFWHAQPFDLGLEPHEGNCDFCFMKGRAIRKRIIRDEPDVPGWWNGQEVERGGLFDQRDAVRDLVAEVRRTPDLFDAHDLDDEHDAECGLLCGAAP